MYIPVPAMSQAISAPNGPEAIAKVRGSENIPAPTMPPTTMAVSNGSDIFLSVEAISSPLTVNAALVLGVAALYSKCTLTRHARPLIAWFLSRRRSKRWAVASGCRTQLSYVRRVSAGEVFQLLITAETQRSQRLRRGIFKVCHSQ